MPAVEELVPTTRETPPPPSPESTALGAIAGCIAHEFNNLLAGVILRIEAAKRTGRIPGESLPFLNDAEEEINRAKAVTDELLSFARLRALTLERIPLRLLLPPEIPIRAAETADEREWRVEGDRTQLKVAFRNLSGYVSRVTASPVISANAGYSPKKNHSTGFSEGWYTRILLTPDRIPVREITESALDPFLPGNETGMGLGLLIGYSIVCRHRGEIQLLQQEGEMSGLAIYLPVSARESDSEEREPQPARYKGRILLMDDEESIRALTEILFGRLGYGITTVRNGNEAIEAFVQARESGHPFDVVILDLTIPGGMGGKETIRRMREIDREVKAIVSSGYLGEHGADDFRTFGFDASVDKPYRLETLTAAVEKLLRTGR